MSLLIPPVPVGEKENSYLWTQWFLALQRVLNSTSGIAWALIDKTGSSLADLATRTHADLQSMQGGVVGERYHLTSAQHTDLTDGGDSTSHIHAAERARANHTGTQTMATISDLPTLAAGVWSPTLTNVTNIAASTTYDGQYLRVGATVVCSGRVDVDVTLAVATELGISLPIASNLGASEDCSGSATILATTTEPAAIQGDTGNNRASLQYIATDLGNTAIFYTFTYQII